MSNRFCPGVVDYDGAMASNYNVGRAVSPHAQKAWHLALEPYLSSVTKVLDVGSGTGRFAVLLAQWFGATVVGVEPASGMRRLAAGEIRHPNTSCAGGCAEQLPFKENSFDVALLSNVYHHVSDPRSCAQELVRVIRSGGRVLIRGVFADRLGEITLFDYFPEARLICQQFPTLSDAVDNFRSAGFRFETVTPVVQQTCGSLKELAVRTLLRTDTTLILLTDEEFQHRQAALEAAVAVEMEPIPAVETLDLLVLQKFG